MSEFDFYIPNHQAKCPHRRGECAGIRLCPLYIESHNPRGLGCVDSMVKDCKVERGEMNYAKGIADLRATDPRAVATCEWHQALDQRQRNMRLLGIH